MIVRRERAMTAVAIMLDIGFHANRSNTASTSEIAERTGLARRGIEPVLQMLSRSGLLASTRGAKGGYHLQRPRGQIKLSDILKAVSNDDAHEDGPSGELQEAVVGPLWQELDDIVQQQLSRISLGQLLLRAEQKGLRSTVKEPLSFSI